jgi:hypothetical protein
MHAGSAALHPTLLHRLCYVAGKHRLAVTCDRAHLPSVAAPNNRTTVGSRNVIRQPQPLTLLKLRAHRLGPTATRFCRPS